MAKKQAIKIPQPPATLATFKILVLCQNYWGKGQTIKEALARIREESGRYPRKYLVFACHPDTRVDDLGRLTYPRDSPAREIDRVGLPPDRPEGE